MGRDLMCHFGIILMSTPDGIQISTAPLHTQFVKYSPERLLYVYEWALVPFGVDSLSSHLTTVAHTYVTDAANYMTLESLLCTAHVFEGPDVEFEAKWEKKSEQVERLIIPSIYWTKNAAAACVSLSSAQEKLFEMTLPHVSGEAH